MVLHDLQRVLNASRHASINSGVIAALEREVGGPAALQRAHVQAGARPGQTCLRKCCSALDLLLLAQTPSCSNHLPCPLSTHPDGCKP